MTPRQTEILRCIALGRSIKEIASSLKIPVRVADMHRHRLLKRFGVATSHSLCLKAILEGVVSKDELPVISTVSPSELTPRQQEVLIALGGGEPLADISSRLGLRQKSIDSHRFRIERILGLTNRTQITHYAIQQGLLRIEAMKATLALEEISCPDCNGTGKYVGLNTVEDCSRCNGRGRSAPLT